MSETSNKNNSFKFFSPDHPNSKNKQENIFNLLKIPKEISERKHVEETYRMLETAVEQSIDGIAVANMDGIIRFCNQAWAKMHGYCVSELLGKHLSIFHTKEQMIQDVIPFNELVKKNGAHHGEVGHVKKDGAVFATWMSTTILKDRKGSSVGLVGIARDITDRKRTEEIVKTMLDNVVMGISMISPKMEIIWLNKTFKKWFPKIDVREKPLCYKSFYSPPRNKICDYCPTIRAFETGETHHAESDICADGEVYNVIATPVKDENGKVKYVVETVEDITERKRMQEALRESELQYRMTIESIADAIHVVDKKLRFILFNNVLKQWNKKLGLETDIIGKTIFEVFSFLPDKIRDEYKRVFETGELLITEEHNTIANSYIVTETRKIPIFDDNEVVQVVTVIRDITERKKAENELKKSEENYRAIFDSVNDAIMIHDVKTGKPLDINPKMVELLGYGREELTQMKIGDWTVGDPIIMQKEAMGRLKEAALGKPQLFEWHIKRKDSKLIWVEVNLKSAIIKGQKCMLAVVRDITERKKHENQLTAINKCFLDFGADPNENINYLVAFCGELMGADCALYNRLEGNLLCSVGKWNTPVDYNPVDKPNGHICYDVIKQSKDQLLIVRNLPKTCYAKSDPNVSRYKLQTYIGQSVKLGETCIGSLCVVYQKDFIPSERDRRFMQILASAIAVEERRRNSEAALRSSEEKYRFLFEENPTFSLILDTGGKIEDINKASLAALGYTKKEVVGKSSFDFIIPEDRKKAADELEKAFRGERTSAVEVSVYAKDGSMHTLLFSPGEVLFYEKGRPVGMLFTGIDITERKKAEKRQIAMTTGLRAVVEAADEFLACPDAEAVFRRAIEFVRNKLGLERCAIFVEEGDCVHGIYGTDRLGRTTDEHAHRFVKNEAWKRRLRMLDPKDPSWVVIREPQLEWDGQKTVQIGEGWIVITPIQSAHRPIGVFINDAAISGAALDPMKQDTLAVLCSLLGNILERKRAESKLGIVNRKLLQSNKRLRHLVLRDSHTGLYNHRYLHEAIEAEFDRAKRSGYSLSVIMLDLDYFKSINDVYGYQFGDLVLKQFARQLKKILRQYDIIIRFDGEEFIIISPGIEKSTALSLSRRLLYSINLCNFGNEEHSVKLRLSLAVASYPEDKAAKGMDLVGLADRILNKAKEDGGDRVYSHSDAEKEKQGILEKAKEISDVHFLREKISRLNKRANQGLIEAVFAFAKTIKLKDHYTGEHVENTVYYATEIARKLKLPKAEIEHIRRASMVHDLGKIGISERILLKKSKLSKLEFKEIKKHPQIGADILRPIHFFHDIVPLVLYHHERWDGQGYPGGLIKEEIPLGARIVAIADVFQALISDRPYRKAFPVSKAREIIKEGSGVQFDPNIVNTFFKILR